MARGDWRLAGYGTPPKEGDAVSRTDGSSNKWHVIERDSSFVPEPQVISTSERLVIEVDLGSGRHQYVTYDDIYDLFEDYEDFSVYVEDDIEDILEAYG